MFVENPGIVSFVFKIQRQKQAKQPLGFPQTYIISAKYKRQKQMKQPLGFPQTYIISTKYKTQKQMKQPLSYDISLWETQAFFHLLLCFVFC
jgi:hypothetical protein